ncbi:hypothetical protein SC1_03817 [Sphingopyxis sp. C-1]|nr:hypothetical protein SC1_03817 [Sphingopyxis sp. C-1]
MQSLRCYRSEDGDSAYGIPTLPPPVLTGSGSTGRGIFRSQPAITDAAPRGWCGL